MQSLRGNSEFHKEFATYVFDRIFQRQLILDFMKNLLPSFLSLFLEAANYDLTIPARSINIDIAVGPTMFFS
jgi:hypothetical protein